MLFKDPCKCFHTVTQGTNLVRCYALKGMGAVLDCRSIPPIALGTTPCILVL